MKRKVLSGAALLATGALCVAAPASAQTPAPVPAPVVSPAPPAPATPTPADQLFNEAMVLRGAGDYTAACPKFAASKELAPGIGVTLYLAECYERTGRPASAWREFREAEKLARAKGDKRADVAAARAAALEPTLDRITVAAPEGGLPANTVITVDGAAVPADFVGTPLAVNPGDHVVAVTYPGQASLSFTAHVDAQTPTTTIRIAAPSTSPATPPAAPGATSSAPAAATSATPAAADAGGNTAARVGGIALGVVGAAGIGVGVWLLTDKVREVMPDGSVCDPHLRAHAIPEGVAAIAVGAGAVVSGVVLYLVNRPHSTEVSLAPSITPQGASAVLTGRF
jgi:serine/threonine-protein kinase